jgi:hypothetical protein
MKPLCDLLYMCTGDVVARAYDEYDVSDRLKESGWVLPAYTMAPNAKHIKLLRAVIRYVCGNGDEGKGLTGSKGGGAACGTWLHVAFGGGCE